VDSAYRNPEWKAIQKILEALTQKQNQITISPIEQNPRPISREEWEGRTK